MELRHALTVVGMSLSAFLTTGCILFPRDTSQGEVQTKAVDQRIAIERGKTLLVDNAQVPPIVPPPPPVPSDYVAHPAAAP